MPVATVAAPSHRSANSSPRLERSNDRRAARGLDRIHARPLWADQARRLQLVERLPHADQPGTAAGRVEDGVRHLPAELLDQLEPHHFLALEPVRLLERRAIEPAALCRAFADQPPAFVDLAVGNPDPRAVGGRLANVDLGRFGRADDDRFHPRARGISGKRRAGIAIGRQATLLIPNCFAMDTAMARPRALNDPVGRRPSSLTSSPLVARLSAVFASAMIGVSGSPRLTGSAPSGKRQKLAPLPHAGGLCARLSRVIDRARTVMS